MKDKVFTRLFLLAMCLVIGAGVTKAQNIVTIAGDDTVGYSGNDGQATAARVRNPAGVVVDTSGNVYFAETGNHCIRKVSNTGIITTFAGNPSGTPAMGSSGNGGPATAALLDSPRTMGIDAMGNIYFADWGNNIVRKINTSQVITTVAGNGTYGYGGDGGPAVSAPLYRPSIAVDPAGNIYIADRYNYRIRKVNTSGMITTIGGTGVPGNSGDGGPAVNARMNPYHVTVDAKGNVFFVDSVNPGYRVVRKIDTAGKVDLYMNIWAESMIFDANGKMYFSDVSCYIRKVHPVSKNVSIYAGNGTCITSGDGGKAIDAGMKSPQGIAFDKGMNLYVAENRGQCVRKVTYDATAVDVDDMSVSTETIKVYPNPALGSFTIEMPAANDKVSIIISDMLGRTIETRNVVAGTAISERFDVNNVPPGAYIIKVSSGNNIYRERVLVR